MRVAQPSTPAVVGNLHRQRLWRALQLEDDEPVNYRKTLRWFLWSALVLLVAVFLSTLSFSRLLRS